ncbi:MAG: DUF1304 domain-containing protein [Gemmatimonadaceae bacterium]
MGLVAQSAAVLAGLIHLLIFAMESVIFARPEVHRRFRTAPQDLAAVQPWAYNQGFYNLFLAIGALAGVVIAHASRPLVGRTLALFACACMLGAALVLITSNRRMARGAMMQGMAPLVALVAAYFGY